MPNRPSRRYLLQLATTNLQSFFNEITATGRPWSVCDSPLILPVNIGQSEYLLPVGDDWGRPLDVTTYDASNPHLSEQQVTFTELADQKFGTSSRDYLSDDGHSAHLSFFKKGFTNDQWVSVWPVPTRSCFYRILYSLGNFASEMSLDDSPLLAHHHALVVVKTALDALPASAWWAVESENRMRRNELKESLSRRMPVLLDDFRRFVRSVTQPRMTMRSLYAVD